METREYKIKSLPTNYNGILFRSKLEAKWACFLTELGYTYEYEPEGFTDGEIAYVPDFLINELDMFLEVKPMGEISKKEMKKIKMASMIKPIGLACGDPMQTHIRNFDQNKEYAEFIFTAYGYREKYGNFYFTASPFCTNYFREEVAIAKTAINQRFNNFNTINK